MAVEVMACFARDICAAKVVSRECSEFFLNSGCRIKKVTKSLSIFLVARAIDIFFLPASKISDRKQ